MEKKKSKIGFVFYEIRNIIGNPFTTFFGMAFPTIMLFIITRAVSAEVPEAMVSEANASVFITMSMMVPMAVILIGYASNYSQELEQEIPMRMKLFGITEGTMVAAKMTAQMIVVTVGLLVYTVIAFIGLDMDKPTWRAALILIVCLYLSCVIFFAFAHGIAGMLKKFGPTFVCTMTMYFGIMMLCGMMGVRYEQLPKALQYVADLLPMRYIGNDFIRFWTGGSYNFVPLIQSFLFMGAVTGSLLLISVRKFKG